MIKKVTGGGKPMRLLLVVVLAVSLMLCMPFACNSHADNDDDDGGTEQEVLSSITTEPASDITTTTATLHGDLDLGVGMGQVEVWFEYDIYAYPGTYWDYSEKTPTQVIASTGSFSFEITGLNPDTTYYFRAIGVAQLNETPLNGDEQSFTTEAEKLVLYYDWADIPRMNTYRVHGEFENISGEQLSYAEIEVKMLDGQEEVFHTATVKTNGLDPNEIWVFEVTYEGILPHEQWYQFSIVTAY
jgi:hypothetical protein